MSFSDIHSSYYYNFASCNLVEALFKQMGVEYGFTKESFQNKANVLIEGFEAFMKKESLNDNW